MNYNNHNERLALLRETARQVAKILEWTLRETDEDKYNDTRAYLIGSEQREICIHLNKNRFEIHGCYPRDANHNYMLYNQDEPISITVAAKRGATSLAKEIRGRFLSDYERLYNLAIERIAQANNREQAIEKDAQAIAETMEREVRRIHGHNSRPRIYVSDGNNSNRYGFFEVSSPDNIAMEIRGVDTETARRIAMILAD